MSIAVGGGDCGIKSKQSRDISRPWLWLRRACLLASKSLTTLPSLFSLLNPTLLNSHPSQRQRRSCCVAPCSRHPVLEQSQLALYIPPDPDANPTPDPNPAPPLRLPLDPISPSPSPSSATPSSLSHWMPISSLHLDRNRHISRCNRVPPRWAAALQTPRPDDSRLRRGSSPDRS
jgi:hypothetical protein